MTYSLTVPFSGNPSRALDFAVSTLTGVGFRLETRESSSLELTGPGMNSTRQSPLLGATRIQFFVHHQELDVEAELGGVERMRKFIQLFPIGLLLTLGATLLGIFWAVMPQAFPLAASVTGLALGVNAIVWLVAAPLMSRQIERRSCEALDAFVNNLTMSASQQSSN